MPAYGPPANRGDIAGTLHLLACLVLAVALMVLDHRGGWLSATRAQAEVIAQPLWRLAGLPAKLGDTVRDDAATRARLAKENETLRNALLIMAARQARLQTAADENARLAHEGYAAGKFDLSTTLLMRRDALEARREHLDRIHGALLAGAELWAALNGPSLGDSP